MPPAPAKQLRIGDCVSVQIRCFGDDYAKDKAGDRWNNDDERDFGVTTGKDGDRWVVDFQDGEAPMPWKRSVLRFESRPTDLPGASRGTAHIATNDSSDDEEAAATTRAEAPEEDSSADEDDAVDLPEMIPASHGESLGPGTTRAEGDWVRDDHYAFDERAKHGHEGRSEPKLPLEGWATASLFQLGKHFLPMLFLSALAKSMTEAGAARFKAGDRRFKVWSVTSDDILQWLGVWVYMLACGCTGGHRSYFGENLFGGSHCLEKVLRLGHEPGAPAKGIQWFECMLASLVLPTYTGQAHASDDFKPVRR